MQNVSIFFFAGLSPHPARATGLPPWTHAAHSALGTGDVTGWAELKQVTGHWSDSRQAVTGVSPVTPVKRLF